jgi:hypothetical protein
MPYTPTTWVNNTTPAINATNLNKIETGIQTAQATAEAGQSSIGAVALDSFAGADDDAKLTAALTYAAAQTYPPTIYVSNRQYTFATVNRTPFVGMRIWGQPGASNPELQSQTKMTNRLHLTGTGPWFLHSAATTLRNVSLGNLSFTGTGSPSAAGVLSSATANDVWGDMHLHSLNAYGLKYLIGTQANAFRLLASTWSGRWDVNGLYGGAIHVAGSDNSLWMDGMLLIDSPPPFATTGSADGEFHVWFDFCDFTDVGMIYSTSEGTWGGIKVSGSSNPLTSTGSNIGAVFAHGWIVTGRNPTQPCKGSTLRVEGGVLNLIGGRIQWGMTDPTAMGHSPADAGVVHHSGGWLDMQGVIYDRANAQAETVPFVYSNVTATKCIVKRTLYTSRGGTWTGLPRVDEAGTAGTVDADAYVTVI